MPYEVARLLLEERGYILWRDSTTWNDINDRCSSSSRIQQDMCKLIEASFRPHTYWGFVVANSGAWNVNLLSHILGLHAYSRHLRASPLAFRLSITYTYCRPPIQYKTSTAV
jgi:hypothetical protein